MSRWRAPHVAFRDLGVACLGLVAATLIVYGRVLGNGFVAYDTPLYLTENPWVLRGLSWEGVRWAFTRAHASNWHPLAWISHMADVELLGLRPGWHAFENVLWHAANALWMASREYTRRRAGSDAIAAKLKKHGAEQFSEINVEYELEMSARMAMKQALTAYGVLRPDSA